MTTIGIDIRVLGTGRTSGVEEYTDRLLAEMIPLDLSVRYKLFYAGRNALVRRPWMDAANVTVFESGRSNRLLFLSTRLVGRPYLDQQVGGADVFFFPHFLVGATSPQCRRVLTVHDLSFERFPEFFSWSRRLWHHVQMRPRAQVAMADRVIAVSQSTADDLQSLYGVEVDKISVIHSGVDKASHVQRDSSKRYILALGTLEPRKNIEGLMQAFEMLGKEFSDVELVIAGPRGWLWKHREHDRVRFVGEVNVGERVKLLSNASVLAYPSFFEGFGFPPLEAMACGTSVIIGANSSMVEICGDAALAIEPYSVIQMRDGLSAMLSDGALRSRLIARGNVRVKQFSWRATAEKTLEAIFSTSA